MNWYNFYMIEILSLMIALLLEKSDCQAEKVISYEKWRCPPSCTTCSAVSGCVTCREGHKLLLHREGFRQLGACVETCPNGYYQNTNSPYSRCYACSQPGCTRCSSSTKCDACALPLLLHRGHCIQSCPDGLAYDADLKSCVIDDGECPVGPWTEWAPCLRDGRPCGYKYGLSWRTRRLILTSDSPQVTACPVLSQYKKCRMAKRHCPIDRNKSREDFTKEELRRWRKRMRRKRKKCISRGKVWRDGDCVRKKKNKKRVNMNLEDPGSPDYSVTYQDFVIIDQKTKKKAHSISPEGNVLREK